VSGVRTKAASSASSASTTPAARSPRREARPARAARPRRRPVGELGAVIRATEAIWRRHHLTYDQARNVAKEVRARLELARPSRRGGTVDRLAREDVDRLIAAGYRAPAPRGLMIKTLYYSGTRVDEFCAVKVEDVYVDEAMIRIRNGKGGRGRTVPIPAELAHELRTHLGGRRAGWLFETRSARRFSTRRVEQIVHEAAARARITKRVYPHLLRHTIAQHLLEGGMTMEQVQRFLGHASSETTQIYAETSLGMIRDAYRRALGAEAARLGGAVASSPALSVSAPARGDGRAPRSDRRASEARAGRRPRAAASSSRSSRRSRARPS